MSTYPPSIRREACRLPDCSCEGYRPIRRLSASRRARTHWACSPFSLLEHIRSHPPSAQPAGVFISRQLEHIRTIRRARSHWACSSFSLLEHIRSHPPSAQPAGVFIFRQLEHIRSHPPSAQPLGVLTFQSARTHQKPSACLLYTSPSPRDLSTSRMPSSA